MVNRQMKCKKKKERFSCQTGTKSLPTSLPPVFFASFSPSLSPHLGSPLLFLASEVRSASLSAQRRWQRPSFSFITTLSLSPSPKQFTHAHLMAVHFSLSVGLSLPIHPSISLHKRHLFSPSACQLGEKTGLFLGGG